MPLSDLQALGDKVHKQGDLVQQHCYYITHIRIISSMWNALLGTTFTVTYNGRVQCSNDVELSLLMCT